jgi:hypothetical protein
MAVQPWHELPPEVAEVLRPALGTVANEIIAAVATIPAYARPMDGPFGDGVRAGVREALRHFMAEVEAGGRVPRSDVYVTLGRGEMRAGRTLDTLLSAYRIGARVAWRRFAAAGVERGLEPDVLYLLAEALFAYIDELSAESAEGYALEQSAAASEAELRRRRLVRLLVRDQPADAVVVEAAASQASWPLPRSVAALVVDGTQHEGLVARLPTETIADTIREVTCALVPDPDGPGRRAAIERAVLDAGAVAGLGTRVAWPAVGLSFSRALAALDLAAGGPELIVASDRTGELLLRSDRGLAGELAAERLAPLSDLSPASRQRLTDTLGAWLAEQGRLRAVAERLGVHPQTVRYRLGKLRELFGDALEDPEARFWIELGLRIQQGLPDLD